MSKPGDNSETCWAVDLSSFTDRRNCMAAGTVSVRGGCVHEHVHDGWLCEHHWEAGVHQAFCLACFEADGHNCEIRYERLNPIAVEV